MAETGAGAGRLDVVLCRGCCCGTDKHPDTEQLCRFLDDLSSYRTDPNGYPVPLPAQLEKRRIDSPREAWDALNDVIAKK